MIKQEKQAQHQVKVTPIKGKNLYFLPFYCLLLGGLLSCGTLFKSGVNVSVTKIGDLQQTQDATSAVYLKGKVSKQAPFLGSGAYKLQDTTGSLWVVTQQTLPAQGDEVLIQGQVKYQTIPLAGKDLGEIYIQEQTQLERKPAQKGLSFLPKKSNE